MALRLGKSFKVAPGVRVNLSKSGVGMSAGVRGARIGVNSKGKTYSSVGIPGTGIYSTSYSKSGKKRKDREILQLQNNQSYDLAIEVFKKAPLMKRNLDETLLELHYNLGLVYETSGDKNNALKHFKKVYAYDMNYKSVKGKIDGITQNHINTKPKSNQGKVKGLIGYYDLEDWWTSKFNKEERDHIEKVFRPIGEEEGNKPLTQGKLDYSSQNAAGLLHSLAGWFNKPGERELAKKIISKAVELAKKGDNIFDMHFSYQQQMEIYYRERENNPIALDKAIKACQEQIKIAPEAAKQFYIDYPKQSLPGHAGYTQLAIILKKQSKYQELIELCQQAKSQGWAGDWDKRIAYARKKMS